MNNILLPKLYVIQRTNLFQHRWFPWKLKLSNHKNKFQREKLFPLLEHSSLGNKLNRLVFPLRGKWEPCSALCYVGDLAGKKSYNVNSEFVSTLEPKEKGFSVCYWTEFISTLALRIRNSGFSIIRAGFSTTSALGEITTAPPNCNSNPHERRQSI